MQKFIEEQIINRYREAINAWERHEYVQFVAKEMGMDKETYCHRYVEMNYRPLVFTSLTTDPVEIDYHYCYEVADKEAG